MGSDPLLSSIAFCRDVFLNFLLLNFDLIFSIPDLKSAAEQLAKKCKEHNVNTVFIATDAPMSEYVDIKEFLKKEDIKVRI